MKGMQVTALLSLYLGSSAIGAVIPVNDDTQIQEDAPTSPQGLNAALVAQSQVAGTFPNYTTFRPAYKQPLMEFTLGSTAVTEAKLTMTVVTPRGAFAGNLYGAEYSFSESTLTWSDFWGANDGTDATVGGVSPANWASDPANTQTPYDTVLGWTRITTDIAVLGATAGTHSLDVTGFYNAHLGQTVTFAIWEWQPINNNATTWQSKQNTGALPPILEITEIPEPVSLLLLAVGGTGLLSRRYPRV